jgi:phage FluMu protein Com
MVSTKDFRCKQCQALLAKHDSDGLSIRRGDLQATVSGNGFTVSFTCYRCQSLSVVTTASRAPASKTAA